MAGIVKYLNKLVATITNFRNTVHNHYGNSPTSYFRFIYRSLFRINTFHILEKKLDATVQMPDLAPNIKVVIPSMEELEAIRSKNNLPREFYYDKIHNVKKCYIVFIDGEIAYIHWVYVKGDYNRFLLLEDGVAEFNNNTTLVKFRGKNLMTKMMMYMMCDLARQGYKKVIGVVYENNPAAYKSCVKAGFQEVGRIKTLGQFNRKVRITA
jgi:RimJ/RimL family protein N-acetyltransferase